jgi:Flp pilus assembly pilin Flp
VLLSRARKGTSPDAGASSVEYGLVVFAIAAVITIAVFALGPPVRGLFDTTCQAIHGELDAPTQSCS